MTTNIKAAVEKRNDTVGATVAHLIDRQHDAIARALPNTLSPDRFSRIVLTEVKANPALLGCEPVSLLAAVMKAAALGLEPGPLGHVYLVPFRNGKTGKSEVQFIIGYKGIVDLARRSGQIQSLYADVVYERDAFDYQLGLHRDLTHKRASGVDRGRVTHAYAVAHYRDGGFDFVVLDELEIDARRKRSKAKDSGPWVTDYAAMCKKSAVRALAAWLPLTVEQSTAVNSDERSYSLDDFGDVVDVGEIDHEPEQEADSGRLAIDAGELPDDAA